MLTLSTKNRAANDLRAQANALQAEIADTTKPMTADELHTKLEAIKSLNMRAQAVAEFTADDDIRRQGDDPKNLGGNLRQEASPEGGDGGDPEKRAKPKRLTMNDRVQDCARRVVDEFGDVRSFMRMAVAGTVPIETEKQAALIKEVKTLTRAIIGTTGDTSGGEFVLPLTQVQSIFSLANVQQGLLQRARAYNVPGRTLRIPYLMQADTNASTTLNRPMAGNIANVTIIGEGSTVATATPQFGQRLLTVYKYAALTQVSDELLGDDFTGELPSEFINAVGQQALNSVNEDITGFGVNSAGSAGPTGACYAVNSTTASAWNINVARKTASQINPQDIFNMYSEHTHGPGSVWFASRRTIQQIYNMSLTSASLVTFLRDLRGLPEMMMLGYPVVLTDLLPTLGSPGDLCLMNPDFYAFALRQALTVESSRDFAFAQDLTTYRFIVRAGGLPINTGRYAYQYTGSQGVDEHSPFVYLQ